MPRSVEPCNLGRLLDELRRLDPDPQFKSLKGMAQKLDVSVSVLSLWRSGRREPNSKWVQRISQRYDRREDDIWFTLSRYRMPLEAAIDSEPPGATDHRLRVTDEEHRELEDYLKFLRLQRRLRTRP